MAKNTAGEQPQNQTEIDLIRHVLADKDISLNALADKTGIPYKTLWRRIEKRDNLLTFTELRNIAAALDVYPSDLLPSELTANKQDVAA